MSVGWAQKAEYARVDFGGMKTGEAIGAIWGAVGFFIVGAGTLTTLIALIVHKTRR